MCYGSVRGTLQGEQFYLDRDSLDDHESEESGKQIQDKDKDKGSDKGSVIDQDKGSHKGNDNDKDNDHKDDKKDKDKDKDKEGSSLWSWLATTLTPTKPPAPAPAPALTRATPDPSCLFVGKYADQRAKMDYSYHSHYQPDRQVVMMVVVAVC